MRRFEVLLAGPADGATVEWLANGFEQEGCAVQIYPYRHFSIMHGLHRMNQDFAEAAQEADLTVVLKGEQFYPRVLGGLRQAGCRVALWHLDPWEGRQTWVMDLASQVQHFFTVAGGLVPDYKAIGANAHWLPEGCEPAIHTPHMIHPADDVYPVSFVGTIGQVEGREAWLTSLRSKLGNRLHLFGSYPGTLQGPQHHGRAEEYTTLRGDHGLSWVISHSQVNLGRDRCPQIERSYGARLFRTLAAGGFLVTNDTVGIHQDFAGCLLTYADAEDCLKRIEWGLQRSSERKRIARRGRKKVLAEHTFRHRARTILNTFGLGTTPLPSFPKDIPFQNPPPKEGPSA